MAKKQSIRERIVHSIVDDHDAMSTRIERSNIGQLLYDIFFWQEVCKLAQERLDEAWAMAQSDDGGLIENDDDLRDLGKGEHVVAESERFYAVASVENPRNNFDREAFIDRLCHEFKLEYDAVQGIANSSRAPSRAPLQKRVMEGS